MRSRSAAAERLAPFVLALAGIAFAALATWTLVDRSTIPSAIDGTVTAREVRQEKHPGVDDVWLIAVDDGRLRHVDASVAGTLKVGDTLHKSRWDSALFVNGQPRRVQLSRDARAMLWLGPAIAVLSTTLICAATFRRPRRAL